MHKSLFIATGILLTSLGIKGQVKFEKEVRVKEKNIPSQAVHFIEGIENINKVKWYKEFSLKDTTFEAKAKYKKSMLSVEFTLLGKVEDIEQITKWKSIATEAQTRILAFLKQEHSSTQIRKIQLQYSGNEKDLLIWMNDNVRSESIVVNYEIVLTATIEGRKQQIEYLVSESGVMEKKAFLLFRNSDNLAYQK